MDSPSVPDGKVVRLMWVVTVIYGLLLRFRGRGMSRGCTGGL